MQHVQPEATTTPLQFDATAYTLFSFFTFIPILLVSVIAGCPRHDHEAVGIRQTAASYTEHAGPR
jgi:hypothetical protein